MIRQRALGQILVKEAFEAIMNDVPSLGEPRRITLVGVHRVTRQRTGENLFEIRPSREDQRGLKQERRGIWHTLTRLAPDGSLIRWRRHDIDLPIGYASSDASRDGISELFRSVNLVLPIEEAAFEHTTTDTPY